MNEKLTEDDIRDAMTSIIRRSNDKLFSKTQDQLQEYWRFEYDPNWSKELNLYEFHDALNLYKYFCRKWEEHYNGTCCVVERVRDKYLMDKIRNFVHEINKYHYHA